MTASSTATQDQDDQPRCHIRPGNSAAIAHRRSSARLSRRTRRGLTISLIWGLSIGIAVPSMGSRVVDATLYPDHVQNMAQHALAMTNPAYRHPSLAYAIAPRQMAVMPASARGPNLDDSLPFLTAEPARVDLSQLVVLSQQLSTQPGKPDVALRDVPQATQEPMRVASLDGASRVLASLPQKEEVLRTTPDYAPDYAPDNALSPQQVTPDAILQLGDAATAYAPQSSRRPQARPAGIEHRLVRYSRSWLRQIPLREADRQAMCLATAIYHEARGEELKGQFAVAEVILNRVDSPRFPNTICGVVYQGVTEGRIGGCQFSFACDGRSEAMPNRAARDLSLRIAQVMSDGAMRPLTRGALFFHTYAVSPPWASRFTQTTQIGAHLFYRG